MSTKIHEQISNSRKFIRTDSYSMSVGELASMYRDEDLNPRPEFQRYFRWTSVQKSRFIESLLLGIPVPPIFVQQRDDGVWDVIDGLQRLSSVFEAMGILKGEDKALLPPLTFQATKYLPDLEGKTWGLDETDPNGLGEEVQRLIKRSKLDVSIVLPESKGDTRLELFQRINTGGSSLSRQEIRNCLLLMHSSEALTWLDDLAKNSAFQSCLGLSDKAADEQYDKELAVRFLTLYGQEGHAPRMTDLGSFLDEKILDFSDPESDLCATAKAAFEKTFTLIAEALGDSAFRRYDLGKNKFMGGFLVSVYEFLSLGVGAHVLEPGYNPPQIEDEVKNLWSDEGFKSGTGTGVNAENRLRTTLALGYEKFKSQ